MYWCDAHPFTHEETEAQAVSVGPDRLLRVHALSRLPLSAPEQSELGFCTLDDISVWVSLFLFVDFPVLGTGYTAEIDYSD